MNLGQQDYHVLTTLFQENLKESESYALMEGNARLLLNQGIDLKALALVYIIIIIIICIIIINTKVTITVTVLGNQ